MDLNSLPSGKNLRISRKGAARFAACRNAVRARPRSGARGGGLAAMHIVDIPSRGTGIMMVCLGLFTCGLIATGLATSAPGSGGMEAVVMGAAIFGPVAVALMLGGVAVLYRRDRLDVERDSVSYARRALFRPRSFSAPLGNYACILPESRIYGEAKREMRMAFYARLVHRDDDARNVMLLIRDLGELAMMTDRGGERKPYEDLARSLDLPLATESADGAVTIRYPSELNLSLEAFNEASGAAAYVPGPERPFPTKRYRVTTGPDGFGAERGYPGYLVPFAGFAAASVAAFLLIPDRDSKGGIALVLGAFALFMLAFSLTRARLTVRDGVVETLFTIAGIKVLRQVIRLGKIEEVNYAKDPRYNSRTLRITSDTTCIHWGQGDNTEELDWFRDAILRETEKRGNSRDERLKRPSSRSSH